MSVVATSTVSLNPVFLREIKEVNQELWQLVSRAREMCSKPANMRLHRHFFVTMLARFRDNLALHFSLEEFYGYFDEPIDVSPQLAEQAEQLRAEHRTLYSELSAIAERAETMVREKRFSRTSQRLALRVIGFLDQFEEHEKREDELILQMLDDEILACKQNGPTTR